MARWDRNQFVTYTTANGLAHNVVLAIHQDKQELIWVGTAGGLSRWDGERFVNFTQTDGLVNNFVRAIHEDKHGALWFGTAGGISRWDGHGFDCDSGHRSGTGLWWNLPLHFAARCSNQAAGAQRCSAAVLHRSQRSPEQRQRCRRVNLWCHAARAGDLQHLQQRRRFRCL